VGAFWLLVLLAGCATSRSRPMCAQPFTEGKCLEGTWPATWRAGQWDCKLIQDQLELAGIPADRCAAFVGPAEVAERIGPFGPGGSDARSP
jgi:hypothetical protein